MTPNVRWLAGFFDGEGSINISAHPSRPGSSPNHQLRLDVANTDRGAVEAFREAFGGFIIEKVAIPMRKLCFHWQASTSIADRALRRMYPFLVVKKVEAEIAFQFQEYRTITDGSRLGKVRLNPEVIKRRDSYRKQLIAHRAGIVLHRG